MSLKPYPHQQKSIDEIFLEFETHDKILYQLPTGGGKTIVFTFGTQRWLKEKTSKVVILCHRSELVKQTFKAMNKLGIICSLVTKENRNINHNCDVYICMVETLNNRLQKNPHYLKNVGLIINDECHILTFEKVFKYFPTAKVWGCTATPVLLKRMTFFRCKHCREEYTAEQECCGEIIDEWGKPYTMSEIYENIVVGESIQALISDGKLVQEISYVKNYIDQSKLKVDHTGDFSAESQDAAYSDDNALFNVLKNYEEICKGKKTIIFNSSSHANLLVYQKFKDAGYNIRMFDSVNKEDSGNRNALVKWFEETPDAILTNVNIFTTGFDVTDVQAIILNRATLSLSLFLQMVGRGGRSTEKIYKDHFIVIDGGGNIDKHQEWSDPTRDWRKIFFHGTSKPKPKKEPIDDVTPCDSCGYLITKNAKVCPECDFEIVPKPKKEKVEGEEILKPIREIPPPNGEKIYQYTIKHQQDINFAFKIMIGQILDLFLYYRVTKEQYIAARDRKGELDKKIKKMIQKCYFVLIAKTDISASNNRTIAYLVNKVKSKLEKIYGN